MTITPLAHRSDPTTSHVAASSISAKDQIKAALLALLAEEPRAAFELTEAYFNLREANGWPACKPDGIAKRLSELHKVDHLVEETGRTKTSPYNRPATVWKIATGTYQVCNRILDPETNEYCEFDGRVEVVDGRWRCPGCRAFRWAAS